MDFSKKTNEELETLLAQVKNELKMREESEKNLAWEDFVYYLKEYLERCERLTIRDEKREQITITLPINIEDNGIISLPYSL